MKMLGKTVLAVSLCGLVANAIEIDVDKYKCKTEENVYACTKVGLRDMKEKFDALRKKMGFGKRMTLEERKKIVNDDNFEDLMEVRIDAYKKLSDYCLDDNDYMFFSDKKANQISGRACTLLRNDMGDTLEEINQIRKDRFLKPIVDKDEDLREVLSDTEKKISKMYVKLASRGCELGDFNSCKEAFVLYHPVYDNVRYTNNINIIKNIKENVKKDAETSIKYYQKACKINKNDRGFCKTHEEYIDIEE